MRRIARIVVHCTATREGADYSAADIDRLGALLDRAAAQLVHVELGRVTPLAVPLLVMIGRESVAAGKADDELLLEAESLAAAAMRPE